MSLSPAAEAIRDARLAAGLTLEQIAALARVSRSTVAKIEGGDTPDPGFSVVARLLAAADTPDRRVLQLHEAAAARAAPRVLGIGYEGLDQAALIRQLRRELVEVVVDVRLTPLSRKPGLSKNALADALRLARIDYVHMPALGNPKHNRDGYSDPSNDQVRARFERLLRDEKGMAQLAQLRELAERRIVAVLCVEQDERLCHRQQVLAALS